MFDWLKKKQVEAPSQAPKAHPMLDLALQDLALKEDDVLLDIAFGDAQAMRQILPRLSRGRVVGMETNRQFMERARSEFASEFSQFRVDFKDGVVVKIPFPDGHFTKVLSLDQLHGWLSPDRSFEEICRVLAPGGSLVLVWSVPVDLDTDLGRRIYTPDEVKHLIRSAGFHHPTLRERVEGSMRFYQFLALKP